MSEPPRAEAHLEAVAAAQRAAARRPGIQAPEESFDGPPQYAGFVTRALALAIDAAIINTCAVVVGVVVGLVLTIVHVPEDVKIVLVAVGGVAFAIWVVAYLAGFWAATGQTPGSQVMDIRVRRANEDRPPSLRAALVRVGGLTLSAIPFGLGFLGVLTNPRRRGWHDQLAGTVVVHGR